MLDLMYNCLVDGRLVGETVAVLGPEELTLGEAVKRIARVKKKSVLILPLPTLFHFSMAAILERISKVPLVSVAQVKMLSEGMSKPLPGCDELPDDLKPKTYLTEEVIRSCLPPG
jgi:NADH dehydrogenase